MTYQPAEDSFLIKKALTGRARNKSVLDMGAGSGILSAAAIEAGALKVVSSDIDNNAVEELRKKKLNAVRSNLFSNIKEKFDIIVFNPPYLPYDYREDRESRLATTGGKSGDEIITRFLKDALNFLNPGGKILLLLSSITPRKRIADLEPIRIGNNF